MRDLRRLLPYIRPYLGILAAALVLLVLSGLLEGAIVVMLEPIFNALPGGGGGGAAAVGRFSGFTDWLGISEQRLWVIPLFLILFAVLKGIFLFGSEWSMSWVGQGVVASLRRALHKRLLDQSLAFYQRNSTGQIMARLITDTERIQQTVSRTLADAARQTVLMLTFLGILVAIDWELTIFTFVLAPPVLWITMRLGRRLRGVAQRSQQDLSEISGALQETITGQRIVKAFAMEEYEQRRFESKIKRLVADNMRVATISALNSPIMETIGYISFAPLFLYAGYQLAGDGDLTTGSLAAFIVALFRLYDPIRKLSRMHLHFQQAFASSTRVFELLDAPIDLQESPRAQNLPSFSKEIRFEEATLRYSQDQEPALEGIDLTIPRGDILALVGKSGAGKSSLASLIPRFYDTTSGRVLIDGQDVKDVTLSSLRRQVAVVTQETFLFDDTIRNNIAYGNVDRDDDEIAEASKAAYLHDFIETLPEGYRTAIGERGQRLSGGQRQRLAIARALLKKAPILILDEATSSLDTASERLVQKALHNLMRNCTTVVIAHRLSTVRRADRIVVLDAGRIVESGTHEDLLRRSGLYRELHEAQFEDDED